MKYIREKVLNDIVNEIYDITDKNNIFNIIIKHLEINKIMTSMDELEEWVFDVFKMKKEVQENINEVVEN